MAERTLKLIGAGGCGLASLALFGLAGWARGNPILMGMSVAVGTGGLIMAKQAILPRKEKI